MITPLGGITPTKPGSASLPFFGIEPAIIDPVSGEEISGNDVEGVLAFKQPWPSMARTVWGAHKRYMDTYLNVYKGYYVSTSSHRSPCVSLNSVANLWFFSSPETVLAATTTDTIGSGVVWMMLSMFLDTVCPLLKLRLLYSSTVSDSIPIPRTGS